MDRSGDEAVALLAVDSELPATVEPPAEGGSFEAFYRSHVDRVHRALAVTLGDHQLAREATDEAMARLYAHWRRIRHHDNPAGWAYRVGLNWATSWWRKVRRERVLSERHDTPVPAADPGAVAARTALARLALPHRTVVVCRVLLDLSTAETATVLGIAQGTVKSRLARALAALRADLVDHTTGTEQP